MLRLPPTVFPGCPHHVVPRGRSGKAVFSDDADRLRFRDILGAAVTETGVEVWAYALMRNHVHIVVVPNDRNSLAEAILPALDAYTEWSTGEVTPSRPPDALALRASGDQSGCPTHRRARPGEAWEASTTLELSRTEKT